MTLVAKDRASIFSEVRNGEVTLTAAGQIVREEWLKTPTIREEVEIDAFIVMPNHMHAIVHVGGVGAHGRAPLQAPGVHRPPRSLGSLIAGFKSATTRRINDLIDAHGAPIWQRNYYDRIIRSDDELDRVREYILLNPSHWNEDPENPELVSAQPEPSMNLARGAR